MSMIQSMIIAPFVTGLDTDAEPWIAPPDSFRDIENIHIHHGYLEKRSGYSLLATLDQGLRVMGLFRYFEANGAKTLIAFDTLNAYSFDPNTNTFTMLDSAAPIFSSTEFDYINAVNWQAAETANLLNKLYFTNGKTWNGMADPLSLNGIRYYSSNSLTTTVNFNPSTGGGNTLYGCKLLFTLGQRIITLHTFEYDGVDVNTFPQRARWCAKQSPSNWDDIVAGGGDYADAATGDQIISAQALKNQIIVFFTNSVWALQPTSEPKKAFRWVRLNNYRACDGKMASVSYDSNAIALGIRGITSTDGSQTQRVDDRIMDFTNSEINKSQFNKVFCYRSFETQRWWTLYATGTSTENNKALIFDDDSKAYTTYDISLNCLGYGNSDRQYTLDQFVGDLDYSLNEMGESTLVDWSFEATQDLFLGGDIEGNVFLLDLSAEDLNQPIDATFTTASWNPFIKEGCDAQMVYVEFYVDTDKFTTANVEFYVNDEVSPYTSQTINFLPNLNFVGIVTSISNANPCVVTSPSHGLSTGTTVYIYGMSGMTELVSSGHVITVINVNEFSLDGVDSSAYSTWLFGGSVYLKEFYQTRTWVRSYAGSIGYSHWIKVNFIGGERPFRIHSIKPSFRKRGKRVIN